ncbi:mechanosensitive ion channel family protein [Myroides sp. LJL115]
MQVNRFFIVLSCILLCSIAYSQSKNKKATPVKAPTKIEVIKTVVVVMEKTPVINFTDTLFNVYGNIGSFTSKQRAKSIEEKIINLADNHTFEQDSIHFEQAGNFLNLMYDKEILMSVDSLQAAQENKTRLEAAQFYKEKIIQAVEQRKYHTSWEQISLQVAGVIAIIFLEYFLIKLLYYTYRRIRVNIWHARGKKIKGIFGIIDDQRAMLTAIALVKAVRFLLLLIILYAGLLSIFKLFPYTKHLSDELLNYVLSPLIKVGKSVQGYLPNFFTILVIVLIFNYVRKFMRSVAEKISGNKINIKGFYPDWAFPTYHILRVILFIFMFIFIFPYLPNSDSQIFQGVSVFAGIMLSLGSTSVVGNLVAGLVITYMRPFRIGDRIKLGEFTGDVLEKTSLVTRIKTPKNEIITIPNSNIMSAHTINYTQSAKEHGLILYIVVAVGYDVPWQKVHQMLHEVANRTEHVLKRHKPFILQDQFRDSYIDYQLNVYVKDAKITAKIYSDLRQHTQDVFHENNIELVATSFVVNKIITDTTIMEPK